MKLISMSLASLLVALLALAATLSHASNNITQILESHPSYSTFSALCRRTGVANQIMSHTTITVLVPPNSVLDPLVSRYDTATLNDIISFHVLLDYFDTPKFKAITNGTTLSTTLYQTYGKAIGNEGFVNITSKGGSIRIGRSDHGAPLTTIVQNELYKAPYNISVVSVNNVLVPDGVGAPAPSAAPVNFTEILIQSKNYNTFLSLIQKTGVDKLLEKHDTAPGVTIFAPSDAAFKKLPAGVLSKLSSADEISLLEFHCLGSFFSEQELSTLDSTQQTLASGSGGGSYEYTQISQSKSGGSMINTGYNKVTIGATLYSQMPLALYGVDTILMPTDIFGLPPKAAPSPSPTPSPASSPAPTPSPASSPSPSPSEAPASAASPPAPPSESLAAAGTPEGSRKSAASSEKSGAIASIATAALLVVAAAAL